MTTETDARQTATTEILPSTEIRPAAPPPPELRALRQWVCWKYEPRPDQKPGKPLVNPMTGDNADHSKPSTWATYDQALASYRADSGYEGVGFVFAVTDPFCGIDLDDCRDPHTGELQDWATKIIDRLATYTEVSPSRTGVKLWLKATKPGAYCTKAFGGKGGKVEMFDHHRYFTFTGQHLAGTPTTPQSRQAEADALYEEVFGSAKPATTQIVVDSGASRNDAEIVAKASATNAKFARLWAGDIAGHGSQSEADSALVFHLVFHTKDARQVDRLFRRSGLMRDKWDQSSGGQTYGKRTIAAALRNVQAQYRPAPKRRPRNRIPSWITDAMKLRTHPRAILKAILDLCAPSPLDAHGSRGYAVIGKTKLAEMTGMAEKTAKRHLSQLEALGFVVVVSRGGIIRETGELAAHAYAVPAKEGALEHLRYSGPPRRFVPPAIAA
ncbi:MAG: hypothetical protein K8T25_19355 [Planctomycetia bacterium]|nr:hypothetical protein [Planctomycetia bacterium]